MKLVIVESPYAGDVEANLTYARACLRDCLARGEAPLASHLLYTQPGVLRDNIPDERALGIKAGLEWGRHAEKTVVYVDREISNGMHLGMRAARIAGRKIEFRALSHAHDPVKNSSFILYMSACWRAENSDDSIISGDEQAELWAKLRDALSIEVGTATSLGIGGEA